MRNYQNGKIYTVRSLSRPDLIYVGSTIQPLSVRMGMHRVPSNDCTSKQIVDIGDAYIELIELYPCSSKEELNRREGHFQRSLDCVNTRIAGRTRAEYLEDNKESISAHQKQYNQDNQEYISARGKQYYENNRESIASQKKQYYEDNQEYILAYQKQYNDDNQEYISARGKQYYEDNKEAIKQYYEDNKEAIKQYYEDNKEAIATRGKQYNEDNKEAIASQRKKYYENNKDKCKKYQEDNKEKLISYRQQYNASKKENRKCICGSHYDYGLITNRKRHYASQKHQAHVALIYAKLNGSSLTI
jgi:hypothetical protein